MNAPNPGRLIRTVGAVSLIAFLPAFTAAKRGNLHHYREKKRKKDAYQGKKSRFVHQIFPFVRSRKNV